jgi:type 2 lantibiotic biosynthesis protein LanM
MQAEHLTDNAEGEVVISLHLPLRVKTAGMQKNRPLTSDASPARNLIVQALGKLGDIIEGVVVMAISLSKQDLLDIVAAASTLDERLDKGFFPDVAKGNEEIVNARLDTWCRAIAKGDWEQFHRRLAWDGRTEEMVRRVLDVVRMPQDAPLPTWANTLSEALSLSASASVEETAASQEDENRLPFSDAKEHLPFEELLIPFVLLAWRRCATQSGEAYHLLCQKAHNTLLRGLLQTLTSYAAQPLHLEFSIERSLAQSPLDRLLTQVEDDNERTRYQQFVDRMLQGGLVAFFREYTVLSRLLATVTDLWVEATVEFLQRLSSDYSDIQQVFGGDAELGQVTSVQPSLSDVHHGRRSVIALTFASGSKLVYKPKDLGTELAYHRLLAWCNELGMPLPFKVLKVINRFTHGWVEFVEHEPCKEHTGAQRYYRRAGMLLCLVYALEGTDCHRENLIASGEHPVLVDMETLMHHRPRLEDQKEGALAQVLAYEQMMHSVLRTGLLPNWQVLNDARSAYDVSGLGGWEQELQVQASQWLHVNTDRMELKYRTVKKGVQANKPPLDGLPLRLEEHAEDVLAGFRQMYRFLLERREVLLAPESPLHELAHQQVRFVYRATHIYFSIARKLLDPTYLRQGVERSIQLELLGRAVLPLEGPLREKGEQSRWWPVFADERQAMEQGDIPFFTARASSDVLILASGQEIASCFEEPSFDLALAQLKALGNEDLERQVAFIQGSLYAHVARDLAHVSVLGGAKMDAGLDTTGMPTAEKLVAQAVAVARQIAERAIRAGDGSAAWIAPQYLVQAERFQLQPIDYGLYGGTCGVALFLAAVEKVTGGAGYHELALGAVQPLRQALRDYGERTARDMGIGGASGLGSVVYILTRVSQFLDEPPLLEDALHAARLITAEHIANDKALDIIAGAAGAILGLLTIYDVFHDQAVLERAVTCGQHLLRSRTESEAGYRAWPTIEKKLLTGFSHGAAGIVYALLRLYAATRDADWLAAAKEGIAYEGSVFVPQAGNWPDLRAAQQPAFSTSWCHGAPGIALGRIGGLAMLDSDDVRRDIEIAVQTTQAFDVQGVDHLCCGSLGRVDVLLVAAGPLARPELAEVASQWAWRIVTRAENTGTFALHPLLPRGVYSPGFFQGTAGIGYELLRIAHPDALPSVLLWE